MNGKPHPREHIIDSPVHGRFKVIHPRHPTVYIAGPMTGIEDYNFPAFFAAAEAWRAAGWHVVNPAELEGEGTDHPWSWFMRRDIKKLMECDAIALLNGWGSSRGANFEHDIAKALGMQMYTANRVAPLPQLHPFTGEDGMNGCCDKPDYAHYEYWLAHAA